MNVEPQEDKILITLRGFEVIWSLKRKVTVAREDITQITWSPEVPDPKSFKGRRCPGSVIPGIFLAGSFSHDKHWEFWCVRLKWAGELRIETTQNRYQVIRLSAEPQDVKAVLEWWGNEDASSVTDGGS